MSHLRALENIPSSKIFPSSKISFGDKMSNLLRALDNFSTEKTPAALQELEKAKWNVIENHKENIDSKQWVSLCDRMKNLDVNTCMETLLILKEMSVSVNDRFIVTYLESIDIPLRFLLSLGSIRVGYCALKMLSHIQDDDDAKAFFVKKHLMDTYSDVIEPYTNEFQMDYFADKTSSPLKLKVSKVQLLTFNLIAMMIVFMSDKEHEICLIIDKEEDKKMMTEGAEFFLSTPKLITSISNLNVYRKTSNTLLRISRTKKKIKQEKRFEADRIKEVMTRLPEALEKEKETLSEETPTLAESQSTSSGESITLYDWFGSDSVSSNSVQMVVVDYHIDLMNAIQKAKVLCISRDGKILSELISWANHDNDKTLLRNLTIKKYMVLNVHPRTLKNKTDQRNGGPDTNYWKMLRTCFQYKYRYEPTDADIRRSASLTIPMVNLREGLGPVLAGKEMAGILKNLVSNERKGEKTSGATWLANIELSRNDVEHEGTVVPDGRPFRVWTPSYMEKLTAKSLMIFNIWDQESAYNGFDNVVVRASFYIDVSPWILEELDDGDDDADDDNGEADPGEADPDEADPGEADPGEADTGDRRESPKTEKLSPPPPKRIRFEDF